MLGIGFGELFVIFVVALIVLGPQKLPEIGRALGRTIADIRKISESLEEQVTESHEASNNLGREASPAGNSKANDHRQG